MNPPLPLPCGTWPSPLDAAAVAGQSLRLGGLAVDDEGTFTWIEGRPAEGGRNVLVARRPDGATEDLTPPPFSVRSTVHEYGGRSYAVHEDHVFFVSFEDQRLWRRERHPRAEPEPLTSSADGAWRFADLVVDHRRHRLLAVGERHDEDKSIENAIVAIDMDGGRIDVLVAGSDFYASPRLGPDGTCIAWLQWEHPHMPWDAAALWVGTLDAGGRVMDRRHVAGDAGASVFQPGWHDDGTLYFMYEPDGFWNLHRLRTGRVEAVCRAPVEFGMPMWELGASIWGFSGPGEIVGACVEEGLGRIGRIDLGTGRLTPFAGASMGGATTIGHLSTGAGRALVLAGQPHQNNKIFSIDLASERSVVIKQAVPRILEDSYVSRPEAIHFPTTEGDTAHGFFYPPRHPGFTPAPGEAPPLLVMAHGGPTGSASLSLNLVIQFWTTRGFAVLDVNYRGSTGYGRAYRDRLRGQWGVFDVDDCVAGARHLVARGLVDGGRLGIRGGSAGGYTTLAALTFRDAFHAGASHYWVSDLAALLEDTHKFEARYIDTLVGPYPARRDLYHARSPVNFADRLRCPVIFFQGLEDRVVPPSQAEAMVKALREKGIAVEYHAFEGEQHGFRKADTIRRCLEAELAFYGRVFGFAPGRGRSNVSVVAT